jgi:L-asparaginase
MTDAFLSYSHYDKDVDEDALPVAKDLKKKYRRLHAKDLSLFIDTEAIWGNEEWRRRIEAALKESITMISCVSPSYLKSKECKWEWETFLSTHPDKRIFHVMIQDWKQVFDFDDKQTNWSDKIRTMQLTDLTYKKTTDEYKSKLTTLVNQLASVIHDAKETSKEHPGEIPVEKKEPLPEEVRIQKGNCQMIPSNLAKHLRILHERETEGIQLQGGKRVLVICTGGTIGMMKDKADPTSQARFAPIHRFYYYYLRELEELPYETDILPFKTLLDSSNIASGDWVKIARIVEQLYDFYDGFVILHGTDTMSYTASALSFLFENLGKPVILTGSEKYPNERLTDANVNYLNAIRVAAEQQVAEVCILYGGKLMRGNRAKKVVSYGPNGEAFICPNGGDLAEIVVPSDSGEIIAPSESTEISTAVSPRGHSRIVYLEPRTVFGSIEGKFYSRRRISDRIWIAEIFPGMDMKVFKKIVDDPRIKGIILKTFGTGNVPTIPDDFLSEIRRATKARKAVVNVTECPVGSTQVRLSETNARLFELGVVNGEDMTSEAAFCKLGCLLSKHGEDIESIKTEMQIDQKGELKYSVRNITYRKDRKDSPHEINKSFKGEPRKIGQVDPRRIANAKLRIYDLQMKGAKRGKFELRVFLNCVHVEKEDRTDCKEHLIASFSRDWKQTLRSPLFFESDFKNSNPHALAITKSVIGTSGWASLQIVANVDLGRNQKGDHPVTFEAMELSIFTQDHEMIARPLETSARQPTNALFPSSKEASQK